MNKVIILILPIIVFLSSCKRDNGELNGFALLGKWNLVSSCGGVVGCTTANEDYITTIEFKENKIIEQANDPQASTSIYYKELNYTLINVINQDNKATYKIRLEDGTVYMIDVFADHLVLSDDLFWKTYNKF